MTFGCMCPMLERTRRGLFTLQAWRSGPGRSAGRCHESIHAGRSLDGGCVSHCTQGDSGETKGETQPRREPQWSTTQCGKHWRNRVLSRTQAEQVAETAGVSRLRRCRMAHRWVSKQWQQRRALLPSAALSEGQRGDGGMGLRWSSSGKVTTVLNLTRNGWKS